MSRRSLGTERPPTLFTSTLAGATADRRARLSAQVLAALSREFSIEVVGQLNGQPLISRDAFPHYYTTWYACDNGGELNIGPVNRDEEMRPVAYTGWGLLLDAGTIAYRIDAVLRGEEIDYDARHPHLVAESARAGSPPESPAAETPYGAKGEQLAAAAEEMFALLEEAVPGGVPEANWPAWRARAESIVARIMGPDWLERRVAARRKASE